jgi:hypothetical protein
MFLSPEAAPQDTHSGLFKLLLLKKKTTWDFSVSLNSCAFALKPHCLVENNYLIRAIL